MSQHAKQLYDALVTLSHHFSTTCCESSHCEEFTLIDYLALRSIQNQPECSVQTVGQSLGFTKSGATRVIKRLQARNMISICVNPDDSRIKCLSLTELAENCLQSVVSIQEKRMDKLLKKMEPETAKQLTQGLQTLVQQLK
ncbi:MarR family winged helix-turn-helix transcriptional regulator [Endozoicomonas euniceicola]|uniref:MarR family transcriptional regulator n=1 Tax=Endozoicomonas euniceicola TaxID=1234143 RepID=A0ABY6GZH7_9GAMM|nr:MarR family transcriptional regulator [Endozoicomonas euniceicola]UYM17784.1 MarR family transcriptional regulator [Endozoicomonas euniceicola]